MSRFAFTKLAALLLAMASGDALRAAAPAKGSPPASAGRLDWDSVEDRERAQMRELMASSDWPMRVFGLMRLERYGGAEPEKIAIDGLRDSSWAVRCFAIDAVARLGVEPPADALATETDARVLRAALRAGLTAEDDAVQRIGIALMRERNLDDLMLGLELATASTIDALREEARRRIGRLIINMDDAVAAVTAHRLAAMVVDPPAPAPRTAEEWRGWLRRANETVELVPGGQRHAGDLGERSLLAGMDGETFSRLLDYLGFLRGRELELAIVMDATASMLPMVNEARAGVDALILFLRDISKSMRLAFVAYRDHDNAPVWDGHPFTTDITSIREYLFTLRITGGADYPEAVLDGLAACEELNWGEHATREIVLVGDAPPHDKDVGALQRLLDSYRERRIVVHSVHVPMQYPTGFLEGLPEERRAEAREFLETYHQTTAQAFASIAQEGGGDMATLVNPEELVPAIMHFTIEEGWWPVFDQFYQRYLRLCR